MSTQFGDKYSRWARVTKATMRVTHKSGDTMQVDWAGGTIPYYDPITGARRLILEQFSFPYSSSSLLTSSSASWKSWGWCSLQWKAAGSSRTTSICGNTKMNFKLIFHDNLLPFNLLTITRYLLTFTTNLCKFYTPCANRDLICFYPESFKK